MAPVYLHALLWWQYAPAFPVAASEQAAVACVRAEQHLGGDRDATDVGRRVSPFLAFLWEPHLTQLLAGAFRVWR